MQKAGARTPPSNQDRGRVFVLEAFGPRENLFEPVPYPAHDGSSGNTPLTSTVPATAGVSWQEHFHCWHHQLCELRPSSSLEVRRNGPLV